MTRAIITFLLIVTVVLLFLAMRPVPPIAPPMIAPPVAPPIPPLAAPRVLQFTHDAVQGKMVEQVEMVVRPRHALAALCETRNGRFACVLVEGPGPEKFCELDQDLSMEQFPLLTEKGFVAPPPHTSKSMMSVYRSVAKTAMNYRADAGDRMIVLMCPMTEWSALQITCPELKPPQPKTSGETPSPPKSDKEF